MKTLRSSIWLLATFVAAGCDGGGGASAGTTSTTGTVDHAVTWEAKYGAPLVDHRGYSVDVTRDGQYVMAGLSQAGSGSAYLLEAGSDGTMLWYTTFGTEDHWDVARSVRQTADGGYIVGGGTSSFGEPQMWLIKTDAQGVERWNQPRGFSDEMEEAVSVRETADSGYLAAASTTAGDNDIFLLKLGAAGGVEWYDTKGYSADSETPKAMEPTSDGYIVVGTQEARSYMLKVDLAGVTQWFNSRPCASSSCSSQAVQPTADGGFIVVVNDFFGASESATSLLKTDAYGNEVWEMGYASTQPMLGRSVVPTADGGYVMAGDHGDDLFLLAADATGTTLWMRVYGGARHDEAYEVRRTPDGGYVVAGSTQSVADSDFHQAWLIKTDAEGNVVGLTSKP